MFATGRPSCGCPDAITWVSYHALALSDGLPVQLVKDRLASAAGRRPRRGIDTPIPAPVLTGPQWASRVFRWMELMGIEPTTSGLQNRRSPS